MKTHVKSVIFALLVAATPLFAGTSQPDQQGKSLKTGIYFSRDGKLNINVENNSEKAARIQIKDYNNQVVYQKYTASTTPLSAVKLDVGQLPDGEYQVVISNGKDKIKQVLQLETPKVERLLVVGN